MILHMEDIQISLLQGGVVKVSFHNHSHCVYKMHCRWKWPEIGATAIPADKSLVTINEQYYPKTDSQIGSLMSYF